MYCKCQLRSRLLVTFLFHVSPALPALRKQKALKGLYPERMKSFSQAKGNAFKIHSQPHRHSSAPFFPRGNVNNGTVVRSRPYTLRSALQQPATFGIALGLPFCSFFVEETIVRQTVPSKPPSIALSLSVSLGLSVSGRPLSTTRGGDLPEGSPWVIWSTCTSTGN